VDDAGKASPARLKEARVADSEYGVSNPDMLAGFRAEVRRYTRAGIPVGATHDLGPLRPLLERLPKERLDVALFTTAVQAVHLFQCCCEKQWKNQ